jgi:hypothetical protein
MTKGVIDMYGGFVVLPLFIIGLYLIDKVF